MGWSIGFDDKWMRDIGYGVPAVCDHPDCNKEIDRGLSYVCGGEPYGGDHGCGLFFCNEHLYYTPGEKDHIQQCERCSRNVLPFVPKPDVPEWINWKLTDDSWEQWRKDNPLEVLRLEQELASIDPVESKTMEFE